MHFKDYHVHLEKGPYTIEWLKRFFDEGKKNSIEEIGFSEHGHRFLQAKDLHKSEGFRGQWTSTEAVCDIDDYIQLVKEAKDMGYPVKLGIEMDYFPEFESEIRGFIENYPFDYVLGSVHWLGDFGFDHPDLIKKWDTLDVDEIYEQYFEVLSKAINSGIFDCMSHPDVIKVFGHKATKDISHIYDKIAKEIKMQGLCVEVSTAGLRKPVQEIYPSPSFMSILKKHDIPIMLNSDAHIPEDVGRDFDKALDFIKAYGYNKLCYFTKRKRLQYNI